ncbi:hypothetical protein GJU40_20190 [Bacillus lacus]|uniref:Uncharacterized protein n=1 Tax=Metabacillus lacus TaxID=1983721 RepID=A0A7X2LZA0_9BACI|nr:hypothetical protein [Metabacillus lacus]MRX74435.1 hypothetical protein [Metabacillus lacus]
MAALNLDPQAYFRVQYPASDELVISSSIRSPTLSCTWWDEIDVEIPLIRKKQPKSAEIGVGIPPNRLKVAETNDF